MASNPSKPPDVSSKSAVIASELIQVEPELIEESGSDSEGDKNSDKDDDMNVQEIDLTSPAGSPTTSPIQLRSTSPHRSPTRYSVGVTSCIGAKEPPSTPIKRKPAILQRRQYKYTPAASPNPLLALGSKSLHPALAAQTSTLAPKRPRKTSPARAPPTIQFVPPISTTAPPVIQLRPCLTPVPPPGAVNPVNVYRIPASRPTLIGPPTFRKPRTCAFCCRVVEWHGSHKHVAFHHAVSLRRESSKQTSREPRTTAVDMLSLVFGYEEPPRPAVAPADCLDAIPNILCSTCVSPLRAAYKAILELKKIWNSESHVAQSLHRSKKEKNSPKPCFPFPPPKPPQPSAASTAVSSQIRRWFLVDRQRRIFHSHLGWLLKKEMRALVRETKLTEQPTIAELLPPDADILEELRIFCPTVHVALKALFDAGAGRKANGKVKEALTPKMKLATGLALTTFSTHANRIQKALAIQLWRIQCLTTDTLQFLSEFDIIASQTTLKRVLDELLKVKNRGLLQWKRDAQAMLLNRDAEALGETQEPGDSSNVDGEGQAPEPPFAVPPSPAPAEATSSGSVAEILDLAPSKWEVKTKTTRNFGKFRPKVNYTVIDAGDSNLVSLLHTKAARVNSLGGASASTSTAPGTVVAPVPLGTQPRSASATQPAFQTLSFSFLSLHNKAKATCTTAVSMVAVLNRIPAPFPLARSPGELPRRLAVDLDPSTWLLTERDFATLREDHLRLIKQILIETLPTIFGSFESEPQTHEHSTESAQSSKMENLGLLPEDDNTGKGLKDVLKVLATYVPHAAGTGQLQLVSYGDGVTADRIKTLQVVGEASRELELGPAAFHRRMLLFREDMKTFYGVRVAGAGACTLPALRAKYFPEGNKKQVGIRPISYVKIRVTRFALQAYVTAHALHCLRETRSPSDNPGAGASVQQVLETVQGLEEHEKESLLDTIAKRVLAFEWQRQVEQSHVQERVNICVCASGVPAGDMEDPTAWMQCGSPSCACECEQVAGARFHKVCIGEAYSAYGLNSPFKQPPVGLAAKRRKGKSKTPEVPPQLLRTWHCTPACADSVLAYSRSLIFMALTHECYTAAVRANDARRLLQHHKLQLAHLHNEGHRTQFRIWHRILALIGGLAPPHVAHDLLCNSTVNFSGGPAGNMEVDAWNEYVNRIWKKYFAYEIGASPPREYLLRKSQLFDLERIARIEMGVFNFLDPCPRPGGGEGYDKWRRDVWTCALEVLGAGVLQTGPDGTPRAHSGFESFKYGALKLKEGLEAYKVVVKGYSKDLDAGIISEGGDEATFMLADE